MRAIREYMRPTDPSRKPGKLLAYLPAFPGPDGKVGATGLEPLLEGFGIQVDRGHRLVGVPGQFAAGPGRTLPPDTAYAVTSRNLALPLINTFSISPLLFKNARPIRVAPTPPGGPFKTHLVMGTPPGNSFWLEGDWSSSAADTLTRMKDDKTRSLAAEKFFSSSSVPVAVAVTESAKSEDPSKPGPSKARLLVFGSDTPLQDRPQGVAVSDEIRLAVLADSVDWLREREASLGIAPKKSLTYFLGKRPEYLSLFTLLAMMVIGIGGLGVGVWLSRRR